jgi:hypothetical protein
VDPLTLPQSLDQTGFAQDLEVARYARLALPDDLRDVGDAELPHGAKSEQPQPGRLTGGPQPSHETITHIKS